MPASVTVSSQSEGIPPVTIISDSMIASINVQDPGHYDITIDTTVKKSGINKTVGGDASCCKDSSKERKKKRYSLVNGEWISQRS